MRTRNTTNVLRTVLGGVRRREEACMASLAIVTGKKASCPPPASSYTANANQKQWSVALQRKLKMPGTYPNPQTRLTRRLGEKRGSEASKKK